MPRCVFILEKKEDDFWEGGAPQAQGGPALTLSVSLLVAPWILPEGGTFSA